VWPKLGLPQEKKEHLLGVKQLKGHQAILHPICHLVLAYHARVTMSYMVIIDHYSTGFKCEASELFLSLSVQESNFESKGDR